MASSVATYGVPAAAQRDSLFTLGGSLTEAGGGVAAVIVAILGLIHIAPTALLAIATIILGASFLLLGGIMAMRLSRVLSGAEPGMTSESLSENMAVESLCGLAGIVLGILALVGSDPTTLVPIAAIVFGGGLLVASATAVWVKAELVQVEARHPGTTPPRLAAGSIPEALIALSGIVLGVLALAGFAPVTLSLAAMLGYGVAVMLKGTSVASIVFALFAA